MDEFHLGASSSSVTAGAPTPASTAREPPPVIDLNDSSHALNQSLNSSIGSTSSSESEPPLPLPPVPQLSYVAAPPPAAPTMHLVQGPDGNFRLETNPGVAVLGADTSASSSSATSASSALAAQKNLASRLPPRSRPVVDPNRTPLFEDDTLPPGWHRKVSQRKSGASAGRYEVFIIGPTHKRFRSRNELKSFFEKTGEKDLNPDDFDFSTFGRNSTPSVNKVRPRFLVLMPFVISLQHNRRPVIILSYFLRRDLFTELVSSLVARPPRCHLCDHKLISGHSNSVVGRPTGADGPDGHDGRSLVLRHVSVPACTRSTDFCLQRRRTGPCRTGLAAESELWPESIEQRRAVQPLIAVTTELSDSVGTAVWLAGADSL